MFAVIFNGSSFYIPPNEGGADKWNGACMDSSPEATFYMKNGAGLWTTSAETMMIRMFMSNIDEQFNSKPDLFDRPWIRWTLFILVPALVFILVSAGIRVSQYGIDHTILVFGDRTLVSGAEGALRISLMSDDGHFYLPEHLTVSLVKGEARHVVFDDAVSDRGAASGVNFTLPNLTPGTYDLELDVRFDKKRRKVHAKVQVAADAPEEDLEIPQDADRPWERPIVVKDDTEIRVYGEDRGVPTGITSTLFLQTTDSEGRPKSMPLSLVLPWKGGEVLERQTDKLGLAAWSAAPPALDVRMLVQGARYRDDVVEVGSKMPKDTETTGTSPLALGAEASPSSAASQTPDAGVSPTQPPGVAPKIIYTGVSAAVSEPIVSLGNPVRVIIEQLSNGGAVYVDLYRNGVLSQAASGWIAGNRAALEVRPKAPGLYRLQVYTTPIGPGNSVAVRHFYVTSKGETAVQALRTLLRKAAKKDEDAPWANALLAAPLEQGGFEIQQAAAFVLSRLYRGHRQLETLVSSRKDDDAELGAFKAKFQRLVMIAVIALGLGVSCFVGLFALTAHRRQQRITQMILSDDESAGDDKAVSMGSGRTVLQGIILFLIVLGAFVSVAVLVDTMTWINR